MGEIIPFAGTNYPKEHSMSPAVAELFEAETFARSLVDREVPARGNRILAREHVARVVGVAPGTIENLDRGRLKRSPGGWLRDALKARVLRGLEGELLRLRHEQHCLLQTGADPRSGEMAEVEAGIASVLSALGR
jgi:hypothetical protein